MPQAKPKPSEIAAEAKRTYVPYIERTMPHHRAHSYLHTDSSTMRLSVDPSARQRLRVAVIDGDPIDVALDWYQYGVKNGTITTSSTATMIPVVNMANEKRPGGDWESGLLAPEECFARRSNLVQALITEWQPYAAPNTPHYPLPQCGGLYSPYVVVFRDGPEQYQLWREFKSLPVISVAPVRRPKLDESGQQYSFDQERELMMEKMRTVLRIAAAWKHQNVCLGAFGVGPVFRNPVGEVARMWRTLLFQEPEFHGAFANVVFAIEKSQPGNSKGGMSDHEVFEKAFDPATIFKYQR